MNRLLNIRLGLALFVLLGLAIPTLADEAKGTLRSIYEDKRQVVLKGVLRDTIYDLSKDAKLCVDGKKVKIGELRVGDQVTIEFQKSGDRMMAGEIRALRKATETTGTVRGAIADTHQLILKGILKDTTYQLEKEAIVWVNGKERKLADLREGDHVRVTFENRGEKLMASEVCLMRK